jgi:hypothetical protein
MVVSLPFIEESSIESLVITNQSHGLLHHFYQQHAAIFSITNPNDENNRCTTASIVAGK